MSRNSCNRIHIDSSALHNNYRLIQRCSGEKVPVMAMVKADAYGHGMLESARAFMRAGCRDFGVAELREAVLLRQAGIGGNIYVTLGLDTGEVEQVFRYDLIPVVYSHGLAAALSAKGLELGRKIDVHVKVDTGMGRLGLFPEDVYTFIDSLQSLKGIRPAGLMSHFPESDDQLAKSTESSFCKFKELCETLKSRFSLVCHIANSGAVLNFAHTCCDMVRAGIALYGYHPAGGDFSDRLATGRLEPAMSFISRVLQVKTFGPGKGISYGHSFRTEKETKIAVIPVGYEDGYSRLLSNRGEVLVGGRMANVRGRICMNMCMLDVTRVKGVTAGDEVVLLGRQGDLKITADDIADKIGTISYEILCMLGNNNSRYIR